MFDTNTFETAFLAAFGLALIAVVAVTVFVIVAIVRNRNALKAGGLDPVTAQSELAVKLANSELLAPYASLENRLAELADLQARGVISADEHSTARARLLAGG
jgi:hypothetical protein